MMMKSIRYLMTFNDNTMMKNIGHLMHMTRQYNEKFQIFNISEETV